MGLLVVTQGMVVFKVLINLGLQTLLILWSETNDF